MIRIGQFREFYEDIGLPTLRDSLSDKPIEHKDKLIRYLSREADWLSPAVCTDVFTGELISESTGYSTDGTYGWRSDLAHYVDKYNLILPADFVQHVLAK